MASTWSESDILAVMLRFLVSLLFCAATTSVVAAETVAASGRVFLDRDGNGIADPSEPGLADVKVSNGRDVVLTDSEGRYRLSISDNDTVFVIKPPGFAVATGEAGLPRFWRHHRPAGSPALRYGGMAASDARAVDFPLRPEPAAGEGDGHGLEVLIFGDPQTKNRRHVEYYQRAIVTPILGKHPRARLGLTLGDVVDDDLSLYPALNRVTAALGLPWLHAAGNHDMDFDAERDEDALLTFRQTFGPDTFAWEEAEASFVVLDDTIHLPGPSPEYVGGLREEQFVFLRNYLSGLSSERRLVLAAHIPFFDPMPGRETFRAQDRRRLFELLRPFRKVLLLTAHGHVQRHYFHGPEDGWFGPEPLHEYNVGAVCGSWWSGPLDAEGLPAATMADGTPNGHAVLRIAADGDYALRWHAAGKPDDHAIALHAPNVLRRGAWPGVPVVANVFMGIEGDRVELRIDGGPWRPMTPFHGPDPRLLAENLRDDSLDILRGPDRLPQAQPSTHLWRFLLPTDLELGEHTIEVRAFDRWRGELRAGTVYRLDEYAP